MTATAQHQGLAVVAGAGPGLGHALLRRFAAGGYNATGLSRRPEQTAAHGFELVACDLADAAQVRDVLQAAIAKYGPPKVVIHNTAQFVMQPFLETRGTDFQSLWQNMVLSAVHLAHAAVPSMLEAGGGTFIVSGATASLRGSANFAAFASAKFALRGLTQSLAREFQPKGLHLAHVLIDGILDSQQNTGQTTPEPVRKLNVDEVADAYWTLAHQPPSAWTDEMDLRPMAERF